MSIKLNLGCGKRILKGYTNIDLHNTKADILHDLTTPLLYDNNTVDEILAEHIVEHFHPEEWYRIVADWSRVLKPGGILHIYTPDIIRCAKNLIAESEIIHGDDKRIKWRWLLPIYGGYRGPGEIHKNGFNLTKLTNHLNAVNILVTDHGYFRDRKPSPTGFNVYVKGIKQCN